jgi:hypothetical protein
LEAITIVTFKRADGQTNKPRLIASSRGSSSNSIRSRNSGGGSGSIGVGVIGRLSKIFKDTKLGKIRSPIIAASIVGPAPRITAGVGRAGARTWLQLTGHGDMQGFDSSSPASASREKAFVNAMPGLPHVICMQTPLYSRWRGYSALTRATQVRVPVAECISDDVLNYFKMFQVMGLQRVLQSKAEQGRVA